MMKKNQINNQTHKIYKYIYKSDYPEKPPNINRIQIRYINTAQKL